MSKFYISPESIKGNIALITGKEAHHILDVMRLKRGARIEVFDGRGKLYQGKILDIQGKKVKAEIEYLRQQRQVSNLQIALVQALPKKNKMDYIVEKCTELGVDSIIPVQTIRTIVKLNKQRGALRRKRWQRIAREAAKQCGRTTIPQVANLVSWQGLLSSLGNFDLKLIFCLKEGLEGIKDILRAPLEKDSLTGRGQSKPRKIAILIGPEGDFSPEEIQQAEDFGCIAVSLGKNVLKSDTACVCALSILNYELR